jgi:uncharacterized C2H2 Zn-finger protein
MKRVKIESNGKEIHLDCPSCTMWEVLGIDDPRKMLNAMPIIEWYPDEDNDDEVSVHKCTECHTTFEVEWDYTNPFPEDD